MTPTRGGPTYEVPPPHCPPPIEVLHAHVMNRYNKERKPSPADIITLLTCICSEVLNVDTLNIIEHLVSEHFITMQ